MALFQLDILKQFCTVIKSITGWPCVIGDQDAPPPKGSYVCVRFVDVEVPTHDTTENKEVPDTSPDAPEGATIYQETVRGQSYCNLEIMIFGPPALDTARKIVNGLQHSARQFDIWNTVGYGGFTGPQNLSEEYGGMFRQKAMINLYLYANLDYTDTADFFTSVNLEIKEPGKFDFIITVPEEA